MKVAVLNKGTKFKEKMSPPAYLQQRRRRSQVTGRPKKKDLGTDQEQKSGGAMTRKPGRTRAKKFNWKNRRPRRGLEERKGEKKGKKKKRAIPSSSLEGGIPALVGR